MESKARFALVGIFISAFSLAGIAIILWIIGIKANRQFDQYNVVTDTSASGLRRDSDVRYKGVKIGKVFSVKIDKDNPQFINIYIDVEKDLPVKTDTKAKISSNGLTGISYINLIGGSKEAPLLKSLSQKKYPVIKTVPTTLEKLSVSASQVMHNMNKLLSKLNMTLDKKTIIYVRKTIKNLYKTTGQIDDISIKLGKSAKKIDKLIDNSNVLVKRLNIDGKNVNTLIDNMSILAEDVNFLVNENRKDIKLFTESGLENINSAFEEFRKTSRQIKNFMIELQQNPSLIIKGKTIKKGPGE